MIDPKLIEILKDTIGCVGDSHTVINHLEYVIEEMERHNCREQIRKDTETKLTFYPD